MNQKNLEDEDTDGQVFTVMVKKVRVPRSERAKLKSEAKSIPLGHKTPDKSQIGRHAGNSPVLKEMVFKLPSPKQASRGKTPSEDANPRSRRGSKTRNDAFDLISQARSRERKVKVEEFEKTTLTRMQRLEENKQAKLLALREQKLEQEEKSFRMQTSFQSVRRSYRSPELSNRRPLLERLDDYVFERQNYIEDERRKRRMELQEKELQECTFSPKTNVSKTGSQRCVEDRLKWRVEKQRRRVSVGIMEGLAQAELSNQNQRINKMSKEKKQQAISGLVDRLYQNAIEMSIKRDLEFRKNMMKPPQKPKSRSQSSQREGDSSRRHSVRSVNLYPKSNITEAEQNLIIKLEPKNRKLSPKLTPQKRPNIPLVPKPAKIAVTPASHASPLNIPKPRRLSAKFTKSESKTIKSAANVSPVSNPPKKWPSTKPQKFSPKAPTTPEASPTNNPVKKADDSLSELKTVKKASVALLVFDLKAGRETPKQPANEQQQTHQPPNQPTRALVPETAPTDTKPSNSSKRRMSPGYSRNTPSKNTITDSPRPINSSKRSGNKDPSQKQSSSGIVAESPRTHEHQKLEHSAAHEYLEGLSRSERTDAQGRNKVQLKTLRYKPLAVYEEESEKDYQAISQEINVNLLIPTPDSGKHRAKARNSFEDGEKDPSEEFFSSEKGLQPPTSQKMSIQNAKSGEQLGPRRGLVSAKESSSSPLFVKRAVPNPSIQKRIAQIFHHQPVSSGQHSGSHSGLSKHSQKDLSDRPSHQEGLLADGVQADSMLDLHPEEDNDSPRGQIIVTKAHLKTLY